MNAALSQYKDLFVAETEEHLALLDRSLISLEKDPHQPKLIDNLFRSLHTLKSSAAAVELRDLSRLAHKAEDLMQTVRSGQRPLTSRLLDALFRTVDAVRSALADIKEDRLPSSDFAETVRLLDEAAAEEPAASPPPPAEEPSPPWTLDAEQTRRLSEAAGRPLQVDVAIDEREPIKWLRAELLLNKAGRHGTLVAIRPEKSVFLSPAFDGRFAFLLVTAEDPETLREGLATDLVKSVAFSEPVLRTAEPPPAQAEAGTQPPQKEETAAEAPRHYAETVRVPVEKLDLLMNLVGEMATTVSGFQHLRKRVRSATKDKTLIHQITSFGDRLANLTAELQFQVMNTRMLPLSTVFDRLHRVVRDTARLSGRQAELLVEGGETELDKKIIDAIGEPLIHLVRNAVDHGIEPPDRRTALGKPASGTVSVSAARHGSRIQITVRDDGRGLDTAAIRAKAAERGLAEPEVLDRMTDREVWSFIFEPAFSTAEAVSEISGRGVGLDIVRTTLRRLGGTVEIASEPGRFTEFLLSLPLTLATTQVVLALSGERLYAAPLNAIRETFSIKPQAVKTVEGRPVIPLRDTTLPLVPLRSLFADAPPAVPLRRHAVIVLTHHTTEIGLVVDRILGTEEIVVKPIEHHFRPVPGLAGAAILGDGRIALVLDPSTLLPLAREHRAAPPFADNATVA